MNRGLFMLLAITLLLGSCKDDETKQGKFIKVSDNGRYFEDPTGKPFFI